MPAGKMLEYGGSIGLVCNPKSVQKSGDSMVGDIVRMCFNVLCLFVFSTLEFRIRLCKLIFSKCVFTLNYQFYSDLREFTFHYHHIITYLLRISINTYCSMIMYFTCLPPRDPYEVKHCYFYFYSHILSVYLSI